MRRVGGFIQAAFAAFWLGRASLTIGGRAEDVLIAVFGVAVIGVISYAIRVTAGTVSRKTTSRSNVAGRCLPEERPSVRMRREDRDHARW